MNVIERNPALPPDEVDHLLRSFFRSEVPDPFPVMRAPVSGLQHHASWSGLRSKLALAASVALLLAGSWLLSGRAGDYPTPTSVDGGSGSASRFTPDGVKNLGEKKAAPAKCAGCEK